MCVCVRHVRVSVCREARAHNSLCVCCFCSSLSHISRALVGRTGIYYFIDDYNVYTNAHTGPPRYHLLQRVSQSDFADNVAADNNNKRKTVYLEPHIHTRAQRQMRTRSMMTIGSHTMMTMSRWQQNRASKNKMKGKMKTKKKAAERNENRSCTCTDRSKSQERCFCLHCNFRLDDKINISLAIYRCGVCEPDERERLTKKKKHVHFLRHSASQKGNRISPNTF